MCDKLLTEEYIAKGINKYNEEHPIRNPFLGSRTHIATGRQIVEIRHDNLTAGWCSNEMFERIVELSVGEG
jgi:hypothetical protein